MHFLIRWLVNIAALFAAVHLVSGVSADNASTVVIAALIIGLLNAFLRPVMVALTLPLTILTFGLFTLVINAFIFYLTAKFVSGFVVAGFWSAFRASIVFSVISFILNAAVRPGAGFRMNVFRNDAAARPRYPGAIDVEAKVEETADGENGRNRQEE
jgi:putative membrane protein